MPPSPDPPLSNEQIELIAKWILQGAKDLECDPDSAGCETQDVSFSNFVKLTIQNHCQGCHIWSTPDGGD